MKRSSCTIIPHSSKKKIQSPGSIFKSHTFHILPAHFGHGRLKVFRTQIENNGGVLCQSISNESVSHIIVEEGVNIEKVSKIISKDTLDRVPVVKCTWLSNCLKNKRIVDETEFIVSTPPSHQTGTVSLDNTNDTMQACSTTNHPGERFETELNKDPTVQEPLSHSNPREFPSKDFSKELEKSGQERIGKLQSKFACAHSSSNSAAACSINSHITVELKKLLEVYQSKNDTWRVAGYQKAISAIGAHPTKITTYEEARAVRGVGDKLAAKVAEIASSGRLRKVEEVCGSEETAIITCFLGVWGAGPATAQAWYAQGFRSLTDLRERASLTRHQKIGLQHYDHLNARIPRAEAAQIHSFVQACCSEVRPGLLSEVCGSYRRGRESCGDVDVLITHPDGHSHQGIFKPLLSAMRASGFLTDDLVTQEDNGNQQKYLGVCRLPGEDRKHRRLDIIVVPYSEYAPAMMYFTGSAHFNRSMRLLATKMGMSLSEHGLRCNVVRKGSEKLTSGSLLPTPTEESIFQHLGLPFRTPQERDH